MEHDEKCEVKGLVRGFAANRVEFTISEKELLLDKGVYCWCSKRAEGQTGEPNFQDLKSMGHAAFNYINTCRRREVNAEIKREEVGSRKGRFVVEGPPLNVEYRSPIAQVIHVDFKNRKRID